MQAPFLFVAMALVLLLAPGPTNTLILVGSATDGLRSSLRLVPAELLGYMIAIHVLAFSIGPFVHASHTAQIVLRGGITLYLVWLAGKLWVTGSSLPQQKAVTPQHVFVVTLLNPKAAIFAFVVLPPLTGGHWLSTAPYLLSLSVLIIGASLSWISLGAAIGSGRIVRISPRIIQCLASAVLIIFAAFISIPREFIIH
jgi:threonine/homoserine/homoserine lactone efflux protein